MTFGVYAFDCLDEAFISGDLGMIEIRCGRLVDLSNILLRSREIINNCSAFVS